MDVSELREEFRVICGTWDHAGLDSRQQKVQRLRKMIGELAADQHPAARDLRRRATNLATEIDHALSRERGGAKRRNTFDM